MNMVCKSCTLELAGMSTENVVLILKNLQDDMLIEMKGKNIHLHDMDALQRICDLGWLKTYLSP